MSQQRSRTSGYGTQRDPSRRRQQQTGQDAGAHASTPARTSADLGAVRARLRKIIDPVVAAAGYDVEDLVVTRIGRRHVVRVFVDADGGAGADAIADVSRMISKALDASEAVEGEWTSSEYVLEVSSPGVDRPLTMPRHWRRNVGRLVKVRVDDRTLTGRITAADEAGVTLDADGTRRVVEHVALGPGRVQVELSRLDTVKDEDLSDLTDGTDEGDHDSDDHDDGDHQEGVDEE